MSTIIRIKRRLDQDPTELLVLNCKRQRVGDESSTNDEFDKEATIFSFAHTSTKKDDIAFRSIKNDIENSKAIHTNASSQSIKDKIRRLFEEQHKENRYRIVSKLRMNDVDDATVLDIEAHNEHEDNEDNENNYVFDVYYSQGDKVKEICEENFIGIYPLENDLVYGSLRDNGIDCDESEASDDSNAENNWRNNYPDEDEDFDENSVTEDDIFKAVMNEDSDRDLSSDDNEYYDSNDFNGDNESTRFDKLYARFKAMNTSENLEDDEDDYFSEEEENFS